MMYLEVDGVKYEGFNSCSATVSLEALCGRFDFSATSEKGKEFPIKRMSAVKIYIDDSQIIDGYVDIINPKGSINSHTITVSGRDRTNDLVDSNIIQRNFSEGLTIEQIAKKIIKDLGSDILVVNESGTLLKLSESQAAEPEETIFQFLRRLAYKSNVLITTEGKGNLLLTKNKQETIDIKLLNQVIPETYDPKFLNKNNVKEYECKYDDSKRFYKYITMSQSGGGLDLDNLSESGLESKPTYDDLVRKTRLKIIGYEGNASIELINKVNEWEAMNRKAKSLIYTATVADHFINKDKSQLWTVNKLVHVIDDFCDIDQQMLIGEITYGFDLQKGSTTTLVCLPPDAYLQKPPQEKDEIGGLLD